MTYAYRNRRRDGWPLCPACGDDELWSPQSTEATIVGCLNCKWHPARAGEARGVGAGKDGGG